MNRWDCGKKIYRQLKLETRNGQLINQCDRQTEQQSKASQLKTGTIPNPHPDSQNEPSKNGKNKLVF